MESTFRRAYFFRFSTGGCYASRDAAQLAEKRSSDDGRNAINELISSLMPLTSSLARSFLKRALAKRSDKIVD